MLTRVTAVVVIAAAAALLTRTATVVGDTEGTAQLYVKSSATDGTAYRGDRYAKCFPGDGRGAKGRTLIYRVRGDADELEDAYDWYSWDVHLAGTDKGTVVVRVAGGFGGSQANKDDLAVGVYFRGKALREYSSLDLVKGPKSVTRSVSRYAWCRRVIGFRWLSAPGAKVLKFGFAVETVDKRLLCFDAATGELLDGWAPEKLDGGGD